MELNIPELARRFFPHLLPRHAEALVYELLKMHFQVKPRPDE